MPAPSYAEQAERSSLGLEILLRYGLSFGTSSRNAGLCRRRIPVTAAALLTVWLSLAGAAQTPQGPPAAAGETPRPACATPSAMSGEQRQTIADAALAIATAIKSNDSTHVQSMASAELAANFAPTAYIIQSTSAKIALDTLRVSQLYRLDASTRKAGDTAPAEFSCTLSGSASEVDFGIPGLPPGVFAFVMVEASGDRPWLLAFLLQQQGSAWKMAGFYQHPRSVAAHDGLWFWTSARTDAKAGRKWLAWLRYGEADQLLRPANFISTTHLDQLRSERRTDAPPELADGVSQATPLVIKAKDGAEFHLTDLTSAPTDDGRGLDLVIHFRADPLTDPGAAHTRNTASARALLEAHPELRTGFTGVSVFAESAGQPPFATEQPIAEIQ